jgi:nucleotide-binding universal stress UspA family protein
MITVDWARIMTPLSGGGSDRAVLAAGAAVAAAFDAELACVHSPADVADLVPWMGDGFMGGVQASAIQSLRDAAEAGERSARAMAEACPYGRKTFVSLLSPVWSALAMEGRLSDLVVFDSATARGKGPLSEAFQQIMAGEQRPTLVAQGVLEVCGTIAVAWDGGKEASRAARTAIPLLRKAASVVILSAPANASRQFDPARLRDFLAARGVASSVQVVPGGGDPAPGLVKAAKAAGAGLLVAGAFGHPRLQEYVFGGATRTFLASEGLSLFLSH